MLTIVEREKLYNESFKEHYTALCFFAFKYLNRSDEAEDLVAEVFIRLWDGIAGFDNLKAIKSFLYISTRNACINEQRHSRYRDKVMEVVQYRSADIESNIQQDIIWSEVHKEIRVALQQLPDKCKLVMHSIYFKKEKCAIVAKRMGLSFHTIKNHKRRGLQLMREKIKNIELA